MVELDMDFVRKQFPAFDEPGLRDQAHFENAGGSFVCRYAIWRLHRFYRSRKLQPHGAHQKCLEACGEMDEARARLSRILGVAADELHFGPSTSANSYVLAQAFRAILPRGAAIIVTNQDHEANTGPWRRLADNGIEIREWRMDPDSGHLNLDDLAALLDEKVRLVCFPHCSNVVGEINPVARICAMSRRVGAATCVDGVAYAPHGLPDVAELGADIYLFSTYKTWGPHQGVMVVRRALAEQLPNQGHFFHESDPTRRLTPAGPDHAQVAACAGVADYIDALYKRHHVGGRDGRARARVVHDMMRQREIRLMGPLIDYLKDRNDTRLLGPVKPAERAPTISVVHRQPGTELARALSTHGIIAGGGTFYADRALEGMGIAPERGVLRLSFLHYTTEDEVDRLIEALDSVL